jgi:hypothetical protein
MFAAGLYKPPTINQLVFKCLLLDFINHQQSFEDQLIDCWWFIKSSSKHLKTN